MKVLGAMEASRLARFQRDVRVLAQVRHPNVVTIHEAGLEARRPWFAMDLVSGVPLEDHAAGALELDEALRITIELAHGVAALHTAGVVHRDLKPANVVVAADDGRTVREAAFGRDGRRIYAVGCEWPDEVGELRAWDVETGEPCRPTVRLPYPIHSVDVDPREERLLVGTERGRVEVWATGA